MDDDTYDDFEFTDDPDHYPHPHCGGCGANGSSEHPDCTCD
ncbi:hypothetical protein ACWF94_35700 [Streptomyces sp. NPDC055078]